jgi:transcription termination factor NusB
MQQRISKFVNGWWNTGVQHQKINKLNFILCPWCKLCQESTEHVLYFSQLLNTTQEHRKTLKSTISSITLDTITNMLTSILRQLSTESENTPRLVVANMVQTEVQRLLKKAIREQSRIGWALMLQGYLSQEWSVAYSTLSGIDMKSDTTTGWSKQISINCLWTYPFNMWEHHCKLLADNKEGLKFTKVDNAIRNLYTEKALFLNISKGFFTLPLAWILAKPTSTKQAHLFGMQPPKSDGKKAQTPLHFKTSSIPLIDMLSKQKPRNGIGFPNILLVYILLALIKISGKVIGGTVI